jgi:hypothetical protein
MLIDLVDHDLYFLAMAASLQWRAPKLNSLTEKPTLSTLPIEIVDKIFMLAIPDDVCVKPRSFVLEESAYVWLSPRWACDLLAISKRLRATDGSCTRMRRLNLCRYPSMGDVFAE